MFGKPRKQPSESGDIPSDDEVSKGNCLLEMRIFIIAGASGACPSSQHLEDRRGRMQSV